MGRDWTRRDLLRAGGGSLVAMSIAGSIAGCSFLETDPANTRRESEGDRSNAKEAPSLAAQVKAGELPPLEERLPEEPLVVEPVERAGVYGGTWNSVMVGPSDTAVIHRTIGYDQLVHFSPDWSEIVPNVARSFDVEDDGRVYTFHLRRGMKWSDGEPFTADDIVFACVDVLFNQEIFPVPPGWLLVEDKLPTVEKVDDYAVRFTFSAPHGLFLQLLATPSGTDLTCMPKHYLQQFHKKYNPDVENLAKEQKYDSWIDLLGAKRAIFDNPELPTLWGWKLTQHLSETQRVVAKRNPYYWKVDPDGRQLPYIDQVAYDLVNDNQVILLKISNGEINMHARHVNSLHNKPTLARNREKGNYDFFTLLPAIMNEMVIAFNLTHEDPVLREIFQNKNFRIAMSHAINRDELITVVFQRQGEAWQLAPRRESEFFDEEFAKQYTEHDVDKANQLLDQIGLDQRDSEGYRLRPDGKRLRFQVEIPTPTVKDFWVSGMELIREHWKAVGVDAEIKAEDRTLFYERKEANKHDVAIWQGDGGLQDAIIEPRWYFPYSNESNYATPWARWYSTKGKEGQEPPEPAKRQMDLYNELRLTADRDEQARLFREILAIAKEQFWAIGTVLQPENYGIKANNFHNVPEPIPEAYLYLTPAPARPEQFFIEQE
jgi:peptide/nickel transport system substrate-binding protein